MEAVVENPKNDGYYRRANPFILNVVDPVGKSFLDIGCGAGHLGAALKAKGAAYCVGVERVAHMAEEARQQLDEVICANIEDMEAAFVPGNFDYLIFGDVLEHLIDPAAVLKRFRPFLKPEGRIVASIPNVAHISMLVELLSGRWRYQSEGLLDSTHLRFFTLEEIKTLMQNTGFNLSGLWYVISSTPDQDALITRLDALRQEFGLGTSAFVEQSRVYQYVIEARISAP